MTDRHRFLGAWCCAVCVCFNAPARACAEGDDDNRTQSAEKEIHFCYDEDGREGLCLVIGRGFADDDMQQLASHEDLRAVLFFGTSTTGAGLQHLVDLPYLQHLMFVGTMANDDCAPHVAKMEFLTKLDVFSVLDVGDATCDVEGEPLQKFQDSGISDDGAEIIAANENLTALNLRGHNLTATGIEKLLSIDTLHDLQISGCELDGDVGAKVAEAHLVSFGASSCETPPEFIEALSKSHTIERLFLSKTGVSDETAVHLGQIRSLKWLSVDETEITQAGFDQLTADLPFTKICCSAPYPPSLAGNDVPWQKKAAYLVLASSGNWRRGIREELSGWWTHSEDGSDQTAYDFAVPFLRYFPGTSILRIDAPPVRSSNLDLICELGSLKRVDLSGSQVDEAFISRLLTEGASRDSLAQLGLDHLAITDATLTEAARLKGLKFLSVDQTAVTDAGIETLSHSPTLEVLSLAYCARVTDASLKSLQEMKTLKKLYVWGASVSRRAVSRFQEQRPDVELIAEKWRLDENAPLSDPKSKSSSDGKDSKDCSKNKTKRTAPPDPWINVKRHKSERFRMETPDNEPFRFLRYDE